MLLRRVKPPLWLRGSGVAGAASFKSHRSRPLPRHLATAAVSTAAPAPSTRYAAVTEEDMQTFERILEEGGKLLRPALGEPGPSNLEAYTSDWTRKWSALACPAVVQPRTTQQVSALLRHCNERGIGVVPQVRKLRRMALEAGVLPTLTDSCSDSIPFPS